MVFANQFIIGDVQTLCSLWNKKVITPEYTLNLLSKFYN